MTHDLNYYSHLALTALRREIDLTPKPGLVDRANNGAHTDMDYATFLKSIQALAPYFLQYVEAGYGLADAPPLELFNQLRQLGLEAEIAMYQATNQVNTHKGVNFSFALILGATGAYVAKNPTIEVWKAKDSQAVCQLVIPMTAHLIENDLANLATKRDLTHGERLFLKYGIKGPRGEASLGFPSLLDKALPYLRQRLLETSDVEWVELSLLLYLMTFVEDGNLIHRGGIEGWQKVKQESQTLFEKVDTKRNLIASLNDYNDLLVARHLSPGGSADLFSLSLYFAFLENVLKP